MDISQSHTLLPIILRNFNNVELLQAIVSLIQVFEEVLHIRV